MKASPKPTFYPSSLSNSVGNASPPVLHDSKSFTCLNSHAQQQRRVRQTTFYPVTAKNSNIQFLRYTVSMNRSQGQKSQTLYGLSNQKGRPIRKMTQQIPIERIQNQQKVETQHDFRNNVVKKNFIPQKKTQSSLKVKFKNDIDSLQNRSSLEQKLSSTADLYSTQRIRLRNNTGTINKKTYTPKYVKMSANNQIKNRETKIVSSFSTANLLKQDHADSPTSQSLSSLKVNQILSLKQPRETVSLQDFQKIKYLGQGNFGQVNLVRHKKTNALFALKQIKKQTVKKNKMEEQLLMEIKMQSYFDHPNILKLYGFFHNKQFIYLILEAMQEGTLYCELKKSKTLKQSDASKKLRDVIDGIAYLHQQTIAHRDIKPENILISNDVCKLCDLGWAAVCEDRRKTLCGTIDYASPQILEGKQYGTAIDLWCLGVLCFELMVGKAPFYHISRKQTMKKIINADSSDINIPVNVPSETRDFINKLLIKNPQQRMSAQQALSHPLILKYKDQELEEFRSSKKNRN